MRTFFIFFLGLLLPLQVTGQDEVSPSYQTLLDYQGTYEYVQESTLMLIPSAFDTTLYAVIDNAKYPLSFVSANHFTNIQDIPVIFQRDKNNKVVSYQVQGQTFVMITKQVEPIEMFPRKELFSKPKKYRYQPPQQRIDGLAVGNLESVFDDSKRIKEMVKSTIQGKYPEVHSILIYKDDALVLEEYFYGYGPDSLHQLRSASKVFIGSLVGIAIGKGYIESVQDQLLPYFKDEYDGFENMDPQKESITIENFLTYRHGLDCENNNPESVGNEQRMMQSADWVKHTLDLPAVRTPGETSSYCSGMPLVLGRLVELATKKPLEQFARENLFNPMGIENYKWRFDPDSTSRQTFNQKYLRPRDLVKLAKMYMNDGKWQGQQILPKAWVQKTFEKYTPEFGYLWEHKYFMLNGKQYNSYLTSGNGGQKINIWPELNMITVFTGGNYNSYEIYGISTPPNRMIPNYILPAVQ